MLSGGTENEIAQKLVETGVNSEVWFEDKHHVFDRQIGIGAHIIEVSRKGKGKEGKGRKME
jgi:hypothetical protein